MSNQVIAQLFITWKDGALWNGPPVSNSNHQYLQDFFSSTYLGRVRNECVTWKRPLSIPGTEQKEAPGNKQSPNIRIEAIKSSAWSCRRGRRWVLQTRLHVSTSGNQYYLDHVYLTGHVKCRKDVFTDVVTPQQLTGISLSIYIRKALGTAARKKKTLNRV